jgi:ribosomal protein S18 acetylase RimI-like enzyme
MSVIIAKLDEEILATYELMKQLRPHLEEETYLSKIKHLQMEYGYNLMVISENGKAKAAVGYRICDSLAWGKYLYVDDLITDQESRSKGFANQLFDLLDEELSKNHCIGMHLDSGVQRHDAHRFYLKKKMKITCHHFEKSY